MNRQIRVVVTLFAMIAAALFITGASSAGAGSVAADSIGGRISYIGPPPVLKISSTNSEPDCEKKRPAGVQSQEVVLNPDHTLQNVLVYVKDGLPNKQYTAPLTTVKVDQSGCMFVPHMIAVMVNQPVQFIDSDNASHNVRATPAVNRGWNVAQEHGSAEVVRFPKFEIGIPVRCNIHHWMRMFISVLSNPYFAVTGRDGTFAIKGLPPGEYTIKAWHEKFGTQTMKVKAGSHADFTFRQ